ncbi:hypothetical protein H6P81_017282 [Aristolochia fimbriata]|uniref:Uncharacterized protein n=1 Tax=Aristolochia fimbriata TaxID=158543 RepID=A0AAV7DXW7_ARIFI|nr:hypothetical protein H6P81_017282 [Aristolochia fimbriata]
MSGGEDHEGDGARRCYSWMAAVKTKLESCKAEEVRAPPPTIVKVPRIIRRNNDQAYDPHLLSIGPYHRRPEPRLAPMEKLKWKYLRDFCARNDDESAALDVLLRKIQEVKDPARNCYSQDQIPVRDDDEFGEMLLLDACFVLELFLKSHEKIKRHSRLHDTDLVLASSSECALRSVARDLLLVENQLPFFVLRHIFDSSPKSPLSPVSLETLVVEFFKPLYQTINKMESSRKKTGEDDAVLHILHLIHSHFMESSKTQKDFDVSLSILPDLKTPPLLPLQTVPSAKRLQEAGIRKSRILKGMQYRKYSRPVYDPAAVSAIASTSSKNLVKFVELSREAQTQKRCSGSSGDFYHLDKNPIVPSRSRRKLQWSPIGGDGPELAQSSNGGESGTPEEHRRGEIPESPPSPTSSQQHSPPHRVSTG